MKTISEHDDVAFRDAGPDTRYRVERHSWHGKIFIVIAFNLNDRKVAAALDEKDRGWFNLVPAADPIRKLVNSQYEVEVIALRAGLIDGFYADR